MTDEFVKDKNKKVCENCYYMQGLLGRNPNDNFPCAFHGKMKNNVQNNSYPNWKKRELDNFI